MMSRFVFVVLLISQTALGKKPPVFSERTTEGNSVDKFTLSERNSRLLDVFLVHAGDRWYGSWRKIGSKHAYLSLGGIQFAIPMEDAILPAYHRFYRVSGKPKDFTSRTFTLIKDESLPAELDIKKDSLVAPLQGDEVGRLVLYRYGSKGSLTIKITNIDSRDEKKIARGTVVVNPIPGNRRTVALELEEGDKLPIDQRIFTVRRIVPENYKGSKTVGWVELGVEWSKAMKRRIEARKPPEPNEHQKSNSVKQFRLNKKSFYYEKGGSPFFLGDKKWFGYWRRTGTAQAELFLCGTHFPVPEEDAILPAYRRLYRVSGKPEDFTSRTFTLIKDKDLPAGLATKSGCVLAPLQRGGVGELRLDRYGSDGYSTITISSIETRDKKKTAHGTAVIDAGGESERSMQLKLQEGDVTTVDQGVLTVRKIVPKDFKGTKTVGWVEFGADWTPAVKQEILGESK